MVSRGASMFHSCSWEENCWRIFKPIFEANSQFGRVAFLSQRLHESHSHLFVIFGCRREFRRGVRQNGENEAHPLSSHNFHPRSSTPLSLSFLTKRQTHPIECRRTGGCLLAAIYLVCIHPLLSHPPSGKDRGKSWKLLLLIHESRTALSNVSWI